MYIKNKVLPIFLIVMPVMPFLIYEMFCNVRKKLFQFTNKEEGNIIYLNCNAYKFSNFYNFTNIFSFKKHSDSDENGENSARLLWIDIIESDMSAQDIGKNLW